MRKNEDCVDGKGNKRVGYIRWNQKEKGREGRMTRMGKRYGLGYAWLRSIWDQHAKLGMWQLEGSWHARPLLCKLCASLLTNPGWFWICLRVMLASQCV